MTTPRLIFLYPSLFRPLLIQESIPTQRSFRDLEHRRRRAGFSSTARKKEETFAQRYGPAAEPQLPPPSQPPVPNDLGRDISLAGAIEKEVKAPAPKQEEKKAEQVPPKETVKSKGEPESDVSPSPAAKIPIGEKAQRLDASEFHPKEAASAAPQETSSKPLATVLNREEPAQVTPEEHKPPHLQASRYVHHFDTFTLVRDLQKGGFTQDQSVTLMKAVRVLLAKNMDVAREGLVSKSDIENVCFPPFPFPVTCFPYSHFPTPSLSKFNTHRKPIFSAPLALNSAPKSPIPVAPPNAPPPPAFPISHTKMTSSPSA